MTDQKPEPKPEIAGQHPAAQGSGAAPEPDAGHDTVAPVPDPVSADPPAAEASELAPPPAVVPVSGRKAPRVGATRLAPRRVLRSEPAPPPVATIPPTPMLEAQQQREEPQEPVSQTEIDAELELPRRNLPALIDKDENELDITDLDPSLILVDRKAKREPEVRKRRRHVEAYGASLGLLFGLCGLIAGRLGTIWPVFDVFAQFTMQFIFVTGAFVAGLLLPRLKAFTGLLLTAIAIVCYGVWPLAVSGKPDPNEWSLLAGERALRVAHFNMWQENKNLDAIVTEIERLNPDIMTLIEFTSDKRPILDRLRLVYPYQFDCNGQDFCHLAIIAKHPISGAEAKGVWEGPPYIEARFATLGGLTVIGVHTTRFPHSRAQLRQVTKLVENLATERGGVVMMGDFNATPFSRVITTIEQGENFVRHTNLPSWPSTYVLPQLAIDHIFTSKNIRALTAAQIGNAAGSDHFPVMMTVAIPESR